jgi:hypothetical protein
VLQVSVINLYICWFYNSFIKDIHNFFSLRARFLECFAPQKNVTISSCYQMALKIDATCAFYVEGLIRIHRNKSGTSSNFTPLFHILFSPFKLNVV